VIKAAPKKKVVIIKKTNPVPAPAPVKAITAPAPVAVSAPVAAPVV